MPKVIINDHSAMAKKMLIQNLNVALEAVGAEAQTFAMKDCPVDTGRLRNSINWATNNAVGGGDDQPLATPEDATVYIGTNVEYGPYVEYGSQAHRVGRAHFLRDAAATHGDQYKQIMQAAMKW